MKQPYYIVVAYDGTAYYGWQEQKREQTVAGTLQDAFYRVFRQDIKVVGASRTDAGVHALHQVARFYSDVSIKPADMKKAWNATLPADIHIRKLDRADSTFHPQHNIAEKQYYYHIFPKRPLPFVARYGWWFRHSFDADALHEAMQAFVGTHDFRSFAAGTYEKQSTICTIYSIHVVWYKRYDAYQIRIAGDRFLQHMVRRMVGAAMGVATGRFEKDDIIKALAEQNAHQHFITAPGSGLLLRAIRYEEPQCV